MDLPRLVYGTAIRASDKTLLIPEALSNGYSALDIAANDPHDEVQIGKSLANYLQQHGKDRSQIVLQCKYSPPSMFRDRTPPYRLDDAIPLQVLKSFRNTLKSLKVRYVDLFFLHRPFPTLSQTFAAWEVMEEIFRRGGTLRLGISQVDIGTLRDIHSKAAVKPSVVQNHFSSQSNYDFEVRSFCKTNHITYQAFGLFGHDNKELLDCKDVRRFSQKETLDVQASLVATLLASADRNGEKFSIVIGSTNLKHIQEHSRAFNITAEKMADLESLEEKILVRNLT